jgi:hypothetical protein
MARWRVDKNREHEALRSKWSQTSPGLVGRNTSTSSAAWAQQQRCLQPSTSPRQHTIVRLGAPVLHCAPWPCIATFFSSPREGGGGLGWSINQFYRTISRIWGLINQFCCTVLIFLNFYLVFTSLNFLDRYIPSFHNLFSQILVSRNLFFTYFLFQNFSIFWNFKLKLIGFRWTEKIGPDRFCRFSWKPTGFHWYLNPCHCPLFNTSGKI